MGENKKYWWCLLPIGVPVLFMVLAYFFIYNKPESDLNSAWSWHCVRGYCKKAQITAENEKTARSLAACRLLCSDSAALWPKPTGNVIVGNDLVKINVNSIDVEGIKSDTPTTKLAQAAAKIFKEDVASLVPAGITPKGGVSLVVTLNINDIHTSRITWDLNENYTLKISAASDGRLSAVITAATFFGARHGLVTLSQLIVFDDLRNDLLVPKEVSVEDAPAYSHRGILLDTSRSYVTVETIKRTLKAMGASKMNNFHWHITDSHSFPYVSQSRPELSKLGAYSPRKIYSPKDVADIIQYGKERGVRVMPEFDAPAHVGEGWQNTDLLTCFNWQPWQNYCVEPPCGQMDPTKPQLYDVIEDIYGDMISQFQPDVFHMGGDEVHFNCWNSTDSIVEWMATEKGWGRTEGDFIKLWDYFQQQALERLYKKAGAEIPAIMWTSHLTQKEYVLSCLPKEKYIIQVWTLGNDTQISELLDNGYRLIISNYDALYLDCGFAGWVTDGNNWCAPYIGWQKVYENKPINIAGAKKDQILGAEATLWTEQVDSAAIDSRLWPRAAALAEVLWTEPTTDWRAAEQRFLVHRERLVNLGIAADGIEPEWCLQNEENCRIGAAFNVANTP